MSDLILCNANVITMNAAQPLAELVAISGSRIAHVAGNGKLEQLKGPGTRIVNCKGKTILPGFVDAHCHVHAYVESLVSLKLSPREGIHSIPDIQRSIREFSDGQPAGTWIRGKGYNEFYLAEGRHPTRSDLDAAAPLHPVKLTHRSGHSHVLNSLALEQAGITAETGDPPDALIDRDPLTGMPTGILYGMGEYLAARVPALKDSEIERGLRLANIQLLSYGITSVQDASSINGRDQWRRFKSWKERGLLQSRVTMLTGWRGFAGSGLESLYSCIDRDQLRPGGVKIIVDQVTGSLRPARQELNEIVSAINAAGLQVAIHAIEEPEIEAACDAIADALSRNPRRDHRHRIEHCSVCPPHLIKRLAGLGITVVTQPSFLSYSGDRYLKTVPGGQLEHLYAVGSMRRNNLQIGFSSDFPISDPNPLVGIHAAVTRKTEGGNSVLPGQGITVADALRMYTLGAAAAGFDNNSRGSITPGKLADLVMLSENPCAIDADDIKDIRVIMTVLDGRIVWPVGKTEPL